MANFPPLESKIPFEEKIARLKTTFFSLKTQEAKYLEIIRMGQMLPPLSLEDKTEKNLVKGCQSRLYLSSHLEKQRIFFQAEADALISAGLAALLIAVYSGESPETVIKRLPLFLHELGIYASLSPHRSNGLAQIHLRMQRDALNSLVKAPSFS